MRRTIATLALLLALLATAPVWAAEAPADPELDRFVYSAVLEGLNELRPPHATVDRVLEEDSEGRPVSFIPGCPICMPAREAFRAYRAQPEPGSPTSGALLESLGSEKDLERTAALGRLVQDLVTRRIAASGWSDAEAEVWAQRFQSAAAEGQRQLSAHQARGVEAYEMMWSCMICDGASRACKRR